ncbi:Ribosomal protein S18 acetylase RimI [Clostridium sp. USBA 49]|jgi:ribosomal protein S18 acetylase RimI-like enzyme|uniref:GNAT family N-acetyltransferase n=1 Tax=Clostridium TaxID=1485 RepID=UPI000999CE55|nr:MULTISPECIES: GNAT family N-acetyltransferase [Clostridium]SKA75277.1 Ribosomal protein S18 acetylase RimI [Clostridium sp. USBA 49]
MFDININMDNMVISNIERQDILYIKDWINNQNLSYLNNTKPIDFNELYERFLEYYVSENEFFLKITNDDNLIGIIKGRIEFKNLNEVWIWNFIIDEKYRGNGIGSKIIDSIKNYFLNSFGIYSFYTVACEKDIKALKFWNKNGFEISRISKGYFNINGNDFDMFILKT